MTYVGVIFGPVSGGGGGSLAMVKNPLIIFLVQICIVISATCNFFFFFLTTDHSALFDYFLIHTVFQLDGMFLPQSTPVSCSVSSKLVYPVVTAAQGVISI